MGKTIPTFKTDEEAEVFVETADLSDYDLSGFKPVHFEFHAKDRQINMRLPQPLLEAVKAAVNSEGVPYQRYIRRALERAVISNKA